MDNLGWETNLAKIKEIASREKDENWDFRTFLKGCDEEEVDAVVNRLFAEISPYIDCTSCGNCCTRITPSFSPEDVAKLAHGLGIKNEELCEKYLTRDEEEPDYYVLLKLPCPFFQENRCMQYDYRPDDCVSYPHLHKEEFTTRLASVLNNIFICPVIFHVWQRLKEHYRFGKRIQRRRD